MKMTAFKFFIFVGFITFSYEENNIELDSECHPCEHTFIYSKYQPKINFICSDNFPNQGNYSQDYCVFEFHIRKSMSLGLKFHEVYVDTEVIFKIIS